MLSRKSPFLALGLALLLVGVANVQAQDQQKKKPKDREISTQTGPSPVVKLSDHAQVVTPCGDSAADAQIPLTATVANYSTTDLRYSWRASGGRLVGDGPNAVWDLTGASPGTYTATIEVDNNQNNGCTAFTSTKVIVRPCPPPAPVCPNVSIYCPDTVTLGAPITFTTNISGGTPGVNPVYKWTLSAGTIISGQGTPTIQVDTTGLEGQPITATVSVEGYNLNCQATCTVQIPRKITKTLVDFYPPININNEKARLDNYAIQLQNDPNAKGYVIVYPGRKVKAGEVQKRINRVRDYLTLTRGTDPSRLVTMEGAQRDETTTELWIVPPGADPPTVR